MTCRSRLKAEEEEHTTQCLSTNGNTNAPLHRVVQQQRPHERCAFCQHACCCTRVLFPRVCNRPSRVPQCSAEARELFLLSYPSNEHPPRLASVQTLAHAKPPLARGAQFGSGKQQSRAIQSPVDGILAILRRISTRLVLYRPSTCESLTNKQLNRSRIPGTVGNYKRFGRRWHSRSRVDLS